MQNWQHLEMQQALTNFNHLKSTYVTIKGRLNIEGAVKCGIIMVFRQSFYITYLFLQQKKKT